MRANVSVELLRIFSALRYRDFRLFWTGLVGQITGMQMTIVTMGWLTFDITGSPFALGMINLATALPRLAITLIGGALADRWQPRGLIIGAQSFSAATVAALAALTLTDQITVWHLAIGAVLLGLVQAFDEPSRASIFPRLLPDRSLIPQAVPLISMAWSSTRIVAPSIAGFVIAAAGAGPSFLVGAAGSVIMVAMVSMVRSDTRAAIHPGGPRTSVLHVLMEGVVYVWGNAAFRVVVVLAYVNSFLAMGSIMMLPVFAVDVFGVDSRGLGFMYSTQGVGAILGLVAYAKLARVRPPGQIFVGALLAFSGSLLAFALTPWFFPAVGLLFLSAFFNTVQQTTGQVVLQTLVPDGLRGRVMGVHGTHWSFLPLGGAALNVAAHFVGAPTALAGSVTIAILIVAALGLRNVALHAVRLPQPDEAVVR